MESTTLPMEGTFSLAAVQLSQHVDGQQPLLPCTHQS
jgi:hypothetical protein